MTNEKKIFERLTAIRTEKENDNKDKLNEYRNLLSNREVEQIKDGIDDLVAMRRDLIEREEEIERLNRDGKDTEDMASEIYKFAREFESWKEEIINRIENI